MPKVKTARWCYRDSAVLVGLVLLVVTDVRSSSISKRLTPRNHINQLAVGTGNPNNRAVR